MENEIIHYGGPLDGELFIVEPGWPTPARYKTSDGHWYTFAEEESAMVYAGTGAF